MKLENGCWTERREDRVFLRRRNLRGQLVTLATFRRGPRRGDSSVSLRSQLGTGFVSAWSLDDGYIPSWLAEGDILELCNTAPEMAKPEYA